MWHKNMNNPNVQQSASRMKYIWPYACGDQYYNPIAIRNPSTPEMDNLLTRAVYTVNDQISNQYASPRYDVNPPIAQNNVYPGPRGAGVYEGEGIFDVVKEGYKRISRAVKGSRTDFDPNGRKILAAEGNEKITQAFVCRVPIFSNLDRFASWLSLGKYDEVKKKLGYDNYFHLYLTIVLANGSKLKLEKNEEPMLKRMSDEDYKNINSSDSQCMEVPINRDITLNDLIKKAIDVSGPQQFWKYDVVTANCQLFVKAILDANGLSTPDMTNFIMQNVSQALSTLPNWSQKVVKALPNFKSQLNILFKGVGKKTDHRRVYKIMGGNLSKMGGSSIVNLGLVPSKYK